MVLFAGMISFGSVLNTALVSLSERQREVATFQVLGYTPWQVAWVFAGESFLLNIVGIALGLGGGFLLGHLIAHAYNTELFRFPAVIRPSRLAESAVLMFAFVMLAQLVLYRVIRKLDWLDAMKVRE
jgi:putative ABC transport system permease protein